MDKPLDILNRDAEWKELARIWQRSRPELAIVTGRRRVGKSWLLGRFAGAVGGIYYQATKRTEPEQLLRLSAAVGKHFGDPALERGVSFPDWESLFGYVTDRTGASPFLLILDEFPYLADAVPALTSILQSQWDHEWQGSGMKVILSGSHITAMRRMEEADQPLYGRRTARLDVEPFDYLDAALFLPDHGPEDRLRAFGIFGGLPGHLALLDPGSTLERNVTEQMLSSSGRLVDEAQHLLDAFLADAQVHYSIIDAVAQGQRTWQGITRRVGRDGGSLSRAMQWLMEMGLLEKVVPITERNPARSKRGWYRISDPYLAFWHRFVSPMVAAGMLGPAGDLRFWRHQVAPYLDDYMGPVFESVCRSFVARTDALPFLPIRVGEWWDHSSGNEVDIVAQGTEGELLVAECKWGVVDGHDLRRLRSRAELVVAELTGVRRVHFALFSARGMSDDVRAEVEAGRVIHFDAAALYQETGVGAQARR